MNWIAAVSRIIFTLSDRRLLASGAILAVYVAGQLIWTLWPARTMFFFYTVAYTPFLIIAIAYVAGLWLAKATGTGWQLNSGKIAILGIGLVDRKSTRLNSSHVSTSYAVV